MGASTDPKPLRGPLPGGSEGATVRVHPLLCAMQKAPKDYLRRPDRPLADLRGLLSGHADWIELPIVAFLIEHPTAGAILVDTAFHESVADDPKDSLGAVMGRVLDIDMRQSIPAALADRGVSAADVPTVVMTHLHFDHTSGVSQFPNSTFVVSRAEWEAASRAGGTLHGYRRSQFDHAFDWRSIDFDAAKGIDSFASFGRSLDLFGDGSVRLLFTPGHTKGHMSLVLRLGGGRELLLCGDAAYARSNIDERTVPMLCPDEHVYLRSLDEIRRYLRGTPDAIVIPGHDPVTWPTLDAVYA